jgi:hypothetical protein
MLKGNKGEWSEIYTLFKLLGDGNLFVGDSNLKKIENLFYPIIKIIRNASGGNYEYEIKGDLIIISEKQEELKIPISTFSKQASKLLSKIRGSQGVFGIPEIEDFMNAINCKSIKASSTSKTDIRIVIYDKRINQAAELGFSIKSDVGKKSTLLNASKTTNFIFEIVDFMGTDEDVKRINSISSISKIKNRLEEIFNLSGKLVFSSIEKSRFKNNLVLIDSLLPNILAELLKQYFTSNLSTVRLLTENLISSNPLNFETIDFHPFYEYKIKRFLTDIALGMMPSKVWGGLYDATGGYLIVKDDGDILCYHIYNKNQFEDYLYNNTKLETASSTRHDFGKIYFDSGKLFFKLNLQIRFC